MNLEEIYNNTENISKDKDYWFVRTDGGEYYETFVLNEFIGIGWNYITVDDLKNKSATEVKAKIAHKEGLDIKISKEKSKTTAIYNKLIKFEQLKKGDVIVIPSRKSSRLSFGEVSDDNTFVKNDTEEGCVFRKRKQIKWLETKNMTNLDPMFHRIKTSRQSIINIKKYESYINNVTHSLFLKNEKAHYIVDIQTKDEINIDELVDFISSIRQLSEKVNQHFNLGEDVSTSTIKLNLQSPGKIEFKYIAKKALIYSATVMSVAACNTPREHPNYTPEIGTFINNNPDTLAHYQKITVNLDIDNDKIQSL